MHPSVGSVFSSLCNSTSAFPPYPLWNQAAVLRVNTISLDLQDTMFPQIDGSTPTYHFFNSGSKGLGVDIYDKFI